MGRMNKLHPALLLALASTCAAAAAPTEPERTAPQPVAAASAPGGECAREEARTVTVNGKPVEVRRKVRCPKPTAVKLWD